MSDPLALSLAALSTELRERRVSAVELMTAALDRHERLGDRLRAYKMWDGGRALAAARKVDRAISAGRSVGPLAGVPVSVKDLYGVDDLPTFAGTPRQLPERWSKDAWLVARVRAAGACFVGKTHTVELAFGGVGINPHWETPWNPWDADTHRIPGGSSAGAGVSLCEGSALLALGSDTGGSIRIPAALTGNVGLRTSLGRWPTTGVVPLSSTLDTVGALARTVEDTAWFFGSVDPKWEDPRALLKQLERTKLRGTRVGIPRCDIWEECQPDIREALDLALAALEAHGASLVEIDGELLDDGFEVALAQRPLAATELRAFLERDLPGWIDILHPIIRERLSHAPLPGDPLYLEAVARHRRLVAQASALFEQADVLALPTNIMTPPPVAELADLGRYAQVNRQVLRPNYPVSVLGLTAISIPAGLDDTAMPVGLQLVGRGGADEALLGVALAAERVLGTAAAQFGTAPAATPQPARASTRTPSEIASDG
jgi:aspartyl-tRNA(Asn)/glutamyl-tRNA(Gln) amidotransferase subunit A